MKDHRHQIHLESQTILEGPGPRIISGFPMEASTFGLPLSLPGKSPLVKGEKAEGFRGLSHGAARPDANKTTPKARGPLPPLIRGNHLFFMLNGRHRRHAELPGKSPLGRGKKASAFRGGSF